jgi:choline dehydrogenase-like flavoprotein
MHLDLATSQVSQHDTEICIVGAGAAGITMARRLLAAGCTVSLLESGGCDYEPETADLNRGENVGEPYYELHHARLRFFGGTTAIWGGRVAQLDPVDFERRPWVPHSGWPIGYETVAPYYNEALAELGVKPPLPSPDELRKRVPLPRFDEARLETKLWVFDDRFNRFIFPSCSDLGSHPRCSIFTHATAVDIRTAPGGREVSHILFAAPGGRRLEVRARAFVLAAGGIENPRLLLASRSTSPAGLGNGHDLVGRFFMEHPHARGGRVLTRKSWGLLNAYGRNHMLDTRKVAALIAASEQRQAEAEMLNSSLTVAPRQPANARQFVGMRAYNKVKHDMAPTKAGRALWMHTKRTASYLQRKLDPLRPWLLHRAGAMELALLVRAEQAPNPDSRITLSLDRDAFGMPRPKLDWRFSDLDVHSAERLVATVAEEFERLGLGKVEPAAWLTAPERRWQMDKLISAHPFGGYHHMGTTRMGGDPRTGVTDGFGRVFGVGNLFIAGSSLFPTSGWANPTLTIIALGLRTADHLRGMVASPPYQVAGQAPAAAAS